MSLVAALAGVCSNAVSQVLTKWITQPWPLPAADTSFLRDQEAFMKLIAVAATAIESDDLSVDFFEWYQNRIRPLLMSEVPRHGSGVTCVEVVILKSRILLMLSRCFFRFSAEQRNAMVTDVIPFLMAEDRILSLSAAHALYPLIVSSASPTGTQPRTLPAELLSTVIRGCFSIFTRFVALDHRTHILTLLTHLVTSLEDASIEDSVNVFAEQVPIVWSHLEQGAQIVESKSTGRGYGQILRKGLVDMVTKLLASLMSTRYTTSALDDVAMTLVMFCLDRRGRGGWTGLGRGGRWPLDTAMLGRGMRLYAMHRVQY